MTATPPLPLMPSGSGRIMAVPTAAIRPLARQPRTDAAATLKGLVGSVQHGIVQHPLVIQIADDCYDLVDGERRWRSAQAAGMETITCLVCDPVPPATLLCTQIVANLHREDLNPMDESAALKSAWYILNAHAHDLHAEADAILADADSLWAVLTPLRDLLVAHGWDAAMPAVSQAALITALGLDMSAAALKKKLQVLNASAAVQDVARRHRLTAAAIRALVTLAPEEQTTLLDAIETDPLLVRMVRTIVQGVRQKGRSIDAAIAIAQGRIPDAPHAMVLAGDTAGVPERAHALPGESAADATDAATDPDTPPPTADATPPPLDEIVVMDTVLPVIDSAQQLQRHLDALMALTNGDMARLPDPWDAYAQDALTLLRTTIAPYYREVFHEL